MRRWPVILGAIALLASSSTAVAAPSVSSLQRQNVRLRAALREAARREVTMQGYLSAAQADELAMQGQIAALTVERDNALSGLPAAIRAVPHARMWELVFTPARAVWVCNSYTTMPGYSSLSFESGALC